MALHTVPFVTVNVNVRMVELPMLSKAFIVTRYEPAGCTFVTRTTPFVVLAAKTPLELLLVETLMRVAPVGVAEGVMVVFAPTAAVEF